MTDTALHPGEVRPPLLLALSGHAGAGKDSAATYLEDQYAFAVIAFAEPLLDMLGGLLPHADVDGAWLIERSLKELPMPVLGKSYRTLARTLGDALRAIDPEFFVRIAVHRVRQALDQGSNVVVTDVRYPNEAAALEQMGAHAVRVFRPAAHRPELVPHSSEAHVDTLAFQTLINNGGSRVAFYDQLDELMVQLRA